ncbi:hypothetical protein [Paradesulfitobacterium aromaticivorans]
MFKLIPKIIESVRSSLEPGAKPMSMPMVNSHACTTVGKSCPQCGYPLDGPAMSCPRCRQPLETGCSGNCSKCNTGGSSCTSCK